MKSLITKLIIFVTGTGILFSQNQLNIGILDFTANGVSQPEAFAISDLVRGELVKAPQFSVLDRNNMKSILQEQEFQQTGCTDTDCAVKIGRMLNMQAMIYGSVSKLGDSYIISIGMVDIESGKITKTAREKISRLDDADTAAVSIINQIAGRQTRDSGGGNAQNANGQPLNKYFSVTKSGRINCLQTSGDLYIGLNNSRLFKRENTPFEIGKGYPQFTDKKYSLKMQLRFPGIDRPFNVSQETTVPEDNSISTVYKIDEIAGATWIIISYSFPLTSLKSVLAGNEKIENLSGNFPIPLKKIERGLVIKVFFNNGKCLSFTSDALYFWVQNSNNNNFFIGFFIVKSDFSERRCNVRVDCSISDN